MCAPDRVIMWGKPSEPDVAFSNSSGIAYLGHELKRPELLFARSSVVINLANASDGCADMLCGDPHGVRPPTAKR